MMIEVFADIVFADRFGDLQKRVAGLDALQIVCCIFKFKIFFKTPPYGMGVFRNPGKMRFLNFEKFLPGPPYTVGGIRCANVHKYTLMLLHITTCSHVRRYDSAWLTMTFFVYLGKLRNYHTHHKTPHTTKPMPIAGFNGLLESVKNLKRYETHLLTIDT